MIGCAKPSLRVSTWSCRLIPKRLSRKWSSASSLSLNWPTRGVAIEAEVGQLPMGLRTTGESDHGGQLTDPAAAAAFVEKTGVDLLAVSVGNVHVGRWYKSALDLERLDQIRRRVSVPLVLHGGTGIAVESLREAVKLGVTKVNYGTYLKQRYLAAIRAALGKNVADPHTLLGIGGPRM